MKRRCAAMHIRSSKYGSTFRYWPVPPWSPRCMWIERDVERERGHRDELFAVGVGRPHRAQLGVEAHDVGAEADARRQERHAPRRGLQPEEEHAFVELGRARPRRPAGRCGSAVRARSSRATRTRRRPRAPCPRGRAARRRGRRTTRCVRSLTDERHSARTSAIGLRREPHPPMPTVMPSCTSRDDVVDRHALVGNGQRNSKGT